MEVNFPVTGNIEVDEDAQVRKVVAHRKSRLVGRGLKPLSAKL